jgi:hypothetical protein
MNKIESISELSNERFSEIDSLLTDPVLNQVFDEVSFDELLSNYINSIEALQTRFLYHGIDCPEQYQYLLTIMLNQA